MTIPFTDIDKKYGWPEGLLASVWKQESSCGLNTYNAKSGCRGHFQFDQGTRDQTLKRSGHDAFSADPREAGLAAAFYLGELQRSNGGSLSRALAAYNWGPGNLARKGLANAPKETRDYLTGILGRVGHADMVDFTNRYEAGQTTNEENEAQVKERSDLLHNKLGLDYETIKKTFSKDDLLGSFFLFLVAAIFDGVSKSPSQGLAALVGGAEQASLAENLLSPVTPSTRQASPAQRKPAASASLA
ncbi:MAG: lytic transglycosylase domain-containing protein [Rickettsiales bacterium]